MKDWSAGRSGAGADVRAPRGTALSCKGWEQEGALRMLMNCADPDVAERQPSAAAGDAEATGAGAGGRGAEGFRATIAALRSLDGDETLLVSSGAPAGVLRTRAEAPRVVIEAGECRDCVEAVSAGWLSVGTQTYLPMLFEALAGAARKHFGGTLAGRLVVTCGLGGAGGALPLAATLNGAAFLGIDPDAEQIKRRVKSGYCEAMVNDLDEALRILRNSVRRREPASVGLIGDCAAVISELARRGIVPDLLIDCALAGGVAIGDREAQLGQGLLRLKRFGSLVYRFGDERLQSERSGERLVASPIADFAAEFVRPLFKPGRALLLWVALSGEPADMARADRLALDIFSGDEAAVRWIRLAGKHVQFQGLPARACLLARELRAKFALALNELVARGALKAPVVVGCVDFGGEGAAATVGAANGATSLSAADAASPEGLLAGLGTEAGASSWVALCGAGIGSSGTARFPTFAVVADGSLEIARKIEIVFGGGTGTANADRPRG